MPASNVPEPWSTAMRKHNIGDPRNGVPSINALADLAGVSRETVRQMIMGGREPSQETVQAVADALRIDVRKVSEWVGQSRTVKQPYEAPADAHLLDRDERAAVDEMIRLLAASKKGAESVRDEPVERRLRAAQTRGTAAKRPARRSGRKS